MLASLSILLTLLTQVQFVTGLYTLFRPLGLLGLSRERIAVRLALTLRYAEGAMLKNGGNWRNTLEQMLEPAQVEQGYIELQVASWTRLDWLLIVLSAAVLAGVWL